MATAGAAIGHCDSKNNIGGQQRWHSVAGVVATMHCFAIVDSTLLELLKRKTRGMRVHITRMPADEVRRRPLPLNAALVVDPVLDDEVYQATEWLVEQRPSRSIVCYTRLTPAAVHRTLTLASRGIVQLVLVGCDDAPERLGEILSEAPAHTMAQRVLQSLLRRIPATDERVAAALRDLFLFPRRYRAGRDLALTAGMSVVSIYRRVAAAGLVPPKRLLSAARALRLATGVSQRLDPSFEVSCARAGYHDRRAVRNDLAAVYRCRPGVLVALSQQEILERAILACAPAHDQRPSRPSDDDPGKGTALTRP